MTASVTAPIAWNRRSATDAPRLLLPSKEESRALAGLVLASRVRRATRSRYSPAVCSASTSSDAA